MILPQSKRICVDKRRTDDTIEGVVGGARRTAELSR